MKRTMLALALATALPLQAIAQAPAPTARVAADGITVNDFYKQNIYDRADAKIGDVQDVLMSAGGQVQTLIVSVGGFLGIGSKDVAIPFASVKRTMKDGKAYLTLDTTKDALKAAPGLTYDRSAMRWVPENK